jgi:CRISPR-associated protein Cas2
MQCVVVYDISDDGKRGKIADVCQDYGLDRIQFSAFTGDLAPTHQEELMLKLASVLGKLPGKVQLVPVCEKDWSARRVIDQKPAPSEVEGESKDESGAEKDAS